MLCKLSLLFPWHGSASPLKELLGYSPNHQGSPASRLKSEQSLGLCVFVLNEKGWNLINLKDIESGDKILIDKCNELYFCRAQSIIIQYKSFNH